LENYLSRFRTFISDFDEENEKLFISDTISVISCTGNFKNKGENKLPTTASKIDIPSFNIIYFDGDILGHKLNKFHQLKVEIIFEIKRLFCLYNISCWQISLSDKIYLDCTCQLHYKDFS